MVSNILDRPLVGLTVIEMDSIGPVPHLGAMLQSLGAQVTVVRSPHRPRPFDSWHEPYTPGKVFLELDLKNTADSQKFSYLVAGADVLLEGSRPGVMERLGAGPGPCHGINPSLIYARVTGWGQDGALSGTAGHDINYAAVCGALSEIAGSQKPYAPLNLLADFAGGALHAAVSVLAALSVPRQARHHQILDVAMVDGLASLLSMHSAMTAASATNPLQAPAPYYDTYLCSDGKYVAVGALEDTFFARLACAVGLPIEFLDGRDEPQNWGRLRQELESIFALRPRDEWHAVGVEHDCCLTGVYSLCESFEEPHMDFRIRRQRSSGPVGGSRHPYLFKDPV